MCAPGYILVGSKVLKCRGGIWSSKPPVCTGKFIKFVGEEYQVVKRGIKYHGCGEKYNVEKRERGSNITFPIILRLFGMEEGKNGEKFGQENHDLENGGGEEYQVVENFKHPCKQLCWVSSFIM